MRRKIPVKVYREPAPEERVTIHVAVSDVIPGQGFFATGENTGETIAACASAKRLSDWAFEHGAQSVRHDYDCKLSDGEA